MKLYAITFNLFLFSLFSIAAEYDFSVKSNIEASVFSGSSDKTISPWLFTTVEQNWQSTDKKHVLIGQVNFRNRSYNIRDTTYQHSEISPGEIFYKWSLANHRLTLGYQYLRVIDGFDTVGMDSLNPEDQNESLFSENSIRYRTVPALDYKIIFNDFGFHVFSVFQSKTNISNEYLFNKFKSSVNLAFLDDIDSSKFFKRNDVGLRFLGSSDLVDWSLYGLYVYEKSPLYKFNPNELTLTQVQPPYRSYGGNITFDLSKQILRFDIKYNSERSFEVLSFEVEKSNEVLMNLSFEPSEIFGIQSVYNYSHSEVLSNANLLLRKKKIQDFYIRLSKKINSRFSFNSVFIQRLSDSGSAAHFEIKNNLSKSIDVRFGVEYFHRKENTLFTEFSDLSRVYFGFTTYAIN